ncbi:MAG: hypothetical protein JSW55_13400 [Chloroflexota bacterium]|nr:MAG: hypothetical protein JSW55_13400 [Chloroflexota bacterium]
MTKERSLPSQDGNRRILLSALLAALMLAVLFQTISANLDDQELLWIDPSASVRSMESADVNAVDTPRYLMDTTITNTETISSSIATISGTVPTIVMTETILYMPVVAVAPPNTTIGVLDGPDSNNRWTVGFWPESPSIYLTGYEIQEAQDSSFVGATLIQVDDPGINSIEREKDPSTSNIYYYRARTMTSAGPGAWSDSIEVVGNYLDGFTDRGSGWRMVRQDTDDIDQRVYYSGGKLIHRQHGRWDYLMSSPLKPAPEGAYRLEARVRFDDQDNLHTYGLVFGGDWNGSNCPNSRYTSCFKHYYRLLAIWYSDDSGKLRIQLKRIDRHDPDSNAGRGTTLIDYKDVKVRKPPSDWQNWRVDVSASGKISIFVNNNLVGSARDTRYIHNRYFGGYSATNEYAGLRVEFDWFRVTSLN